MSRSSAVPTVFQVRDRAGAVVGAGFLVGPDVAITCAHVVHAAGSGPEELVELAFPRLPGVPRARARVRAAGWRAPDAEDIAVLDLESTPDGARAMALGSAVGCRGHAVAAFGFPAQAPPDGHFGYGVARDVISGGALLQLSDANDLTTGFSGGPVIDEVTGLVTGMITSITAADEHLRGTGIAYATPAEALREACPELVEQQVCPYPGLEPFTAEQAGWFHGRETAVETVLSAVRRHRMVLLLGPSGAGKSSLIQAGLLPALAASALPGSDRWQHVLARPGHDLLAALEHAGLPGAAGDLTRAAERRLAAEPDRDRLVVVVDQFEELFTPRPDGSTEVTAAGELAALARSDQPVTVVLVMRNDFYAALDALAPDLLAAALPGLVNVPGTLTGAELREIITRPAEAVGASLESGLPERIVDDLRAADPGGQVPVTLLPPLQLALRQVWQRREAGRLTHRGYHDIGEVTGALTTWCDTALGQLRPGHRPTAQRVLTALVRPADDIRGIPATRQHVPLTALRALAAEPGAPAADVFGEVLAALTRYRIVTTGTAAGDGEPSAELIHDTLLRDWADLHEWIVQDHRFQTWLHRATEQHRHHSRSRQPADLLAGSALAEGLDWAAQRSLPEDITAFLTASRDRQQAATRRTRRLNTVLGVLLAVALVAAGTAIYQGRVAVTEQRMAQSRQLAAQSESLLETRPDLAALLAVEAHRSHPTDEAVAALHNAADRIPRQSISIDTSYYSSQSMTFETYAAYSPDGRSLAITGDHEILVQDLETGRSRNLDGIGYATAVAFGPDGRTVAAGSSSGVQLWDAGTGEPGAVVGPEFGAVTSVEFSPDGDHLAIGTSEPAGSSAVRLWHIGSPGPRLVRAWQEDRAATAAVTFSPDGKLLASVGGSAVRVWDVASGEVVNTFYDLDGERYYEEELISIAFSPDGRTIATGSEGEIIRLWDVTGNSGVDVGRFTGRTRSASVDFSPDGRTIVTGSDSGDPAVQLWDVATEQARTLSSSATKVESVEFSPDGTTVAATFGDETVQVWDVARPDTAAAADKICRTVGRDLTPEERSAYLPGQDSPPVCR